MEVNSFLKRALTPLKNQKILESRDIFVMDDFYYEEISNLTEAGGWSVDFFNKRSFFDAQARRILNVPEDFVPTLKNGYKFYAEEHMEKATALFFGCAQGIPFDEEIKMVTYDQKVFWARAHGTPLKDEKGEIIGIRGVFQSIDAEKQKTIKLQASLDIIESHNKRLYNFAHIVSHNLRSHVSNLQLTAALFDTANLTEEQKELYDNFDKIATNLDTTIRHLNDVVTIQTNVDKQRENVNVEETYKRVIASIKQIIALSEATFYIDFSEVENVHYVPAYLESILLNFITNSIKYKHEDRAPEIKIFTYEENEKTYLAVEDNGSGIDLDKYGDKVFQLYKTFHNNEDATGLGLFLTKNQVEAMGGKISVESTPGKGSKFTVQL